MRNLLSAKSGYLLPVFVLLLSVIIVWPMLLVAQGTVSAADLVLLRYDENYLAVYVASSEPVYVRDLQFAYFGTTGSLQIIGMFDHAFDGWTRSDGLAEPGSCFVFRRDFSVVLPYECSSEKTYLTTDLLSDPFWFDLVSGHPRDVAVHRNDAPTGVLCPAMVLQCGFEYYSSVPPTTSEPPSGTVATIAVSSAYVRSGPGRAYPVIDYVYRGVRLPVISMASNGWYLVTHNEQEVWISPTVVLIESEEGVIPLAESTPSVPPRICTPGWDSTPCASRGCAFDHSALCNEFGTGWDCVWNPARCPE